MGLRVGVAGVGRLGRAHVRVLRSLPGVDFVGCMDTRPDRASEAAAEYGAVAFATLADMIHAVDAIDVVTTTTAHADVALSALAAGKDVFIEKPLTASAKDGERVVRAASVAGRLLQVGHIERFNAAVEAVFPHIGIPQFIEIHRLAPFSIRGTDVSVVMDLMIHDLDLLGLLVGEKPVEIDAKGAAILTDEPDIVNARLAFGGGCVANVTASRITASPMRKVRVFSSNGYFSIDLLAGAAVHYRKSENFEARVAELRRAGTSGPEAMMDLVRVSHVRGDGVEPLVKELEAFCRCVSDRTRPPVTGEDGLDAVRLAEAIAERVGRARA